MRQSRRNLLPLSIHPLLPLDQIRFSSRKQRLLWFSPLLNRRMPLTQSNLPIRLR